jgi:hypothetical protein
MIASDLKRVTEVLNRVPSISHGGCGVSALAIYRWLKKNNQHKDVKFLFMYCYWAKSEFDINERRLNDGHTALWVPQHIGLVVNKKVVDSFGVNDEPFDDFHYFHVIGSEEQVLKTINTPYGNGWNDDFDRRSNLSRIEELLGIDLSDVRMKYVNSQQ